MPLRFVTDSLTGVPPELATELGVGVARAGIAFDDRLYRDGELTDAEFSERLAQGEHARGFGAPEGEFRSALLEAAEAGEALMVLVTPFEGYAGYAAAAAAAAAARLEAPVPVVSTVAGPTALCSLLVSLALTNSMETVSDGLAAIERYEPLCGMSVVPASLEWLDAAGKLEGLRQQTDFDPGQSLVLGVTTRLRVKAVCAAREAALAEAVSHAGQRASGRPVVVSIAGGASPETAEQVAQLARERLDVSYVVQGRLSQALGTVLGPGSIAIGVAPVIRDA